MGRWLTAALFLTFACAPWAHAQDGSFDPTFASGGRKLVDVSDGYQDGGNVRLRIQSDGKLLMTGTCWTNTSMDAYPTFCATRLHANGDYDMQFGPGGGGYLRFDSFQSQSFPNPALFQNMTLLADGRIVFIGSSDPSTTLVAVLKADGSALDSSVGAGAGFVTLAGFTPSETQVQADGKLLIAGKANGPNGNPDMAIARLRADLSLDTGFGSGGRQRIAFDLGGPSGTNDDQAANILLRGDGRIVLVGAASVDANHIDVAIVQLLPSGQPDTSFGPNHDGRAHLPASGLDYADTARLDRLGRIVLGGVAYDDNTSFHWRCLVNRLLTDGSQDPTFNPSGGVGHPQLFNLADDGNCVVADLTVQNDGGILLGGQTGRTPHSAGAFYFMAAKLTSNGLLDAGFGFNGTSSGRFSSIPNSDDRGTAIAIGNGGLMIAGYSTALTGGDTRFGIGRIQLDRIFRDGFE
ncbi:MAG: hypothetical protein ABI082_13495 [Dokdonella sp.]